MSLKRYLAVAVAIVAGFEWVHSKNFEPNLACGKRFVRRGRIVGGRNAYDGEVPWIASIRLKEYHQCGGTIINRRWIVTAGHCFFSDSKPHYYSVRVGEYDYQHETEDHKHVDMEIEKISRHPDYAYPHRLSNDIALVKLKKDIAFDNYTWPICVDDGSTNLDGIMTKVAGWGKLQQGGDYYSGPLQIVEMPVVENSVCQKRFSDLGIKWVVVEKNQICAGYKEGGKDACQGDSGGPQFIKEGNRYTLVGVISSGVGCARPERSAIFCRISEYLDWMEKTMKA